MKVKVPFYFKLQVLCPKRIIQGLIRIFSSLLEAIPDAKLLLIGEDKLKAEIEAFVKEMNIENNVYFLGRRSDVLQIMACCDVFVLPSLIEGLPEVILESFVNKLPVVAYDVGGIKEIMINNKTGWLIDKGDEESFGEAIKVVLTRLNEDIVENARYLATAKYSNEIISKSFLEGFNGIPNRK